MHLTAKFYHPTFNHVEVIVLTSRQTDAAENIHIAPLCYAGVKIHVQQLYKYMFKVISRQRYSPKQRYNPRAVAASAAFGEGVSQRVAIL